MTSWTAHAGVAAALAALACAPRGQGASPKGEPPASREQATAAATDASDPPPVPLRAEPPRGLGEIEVPGFEPAIAAFPHEGEPPFPVVIAAHGAGDSPEWQCKIWPALLHPRPVVVLCPAGPRLSRGSEGRYFPDHFALERIVFASLKALGDAFPEAVDPKRATYTGYSQGATMGALMLVEHGTECPRLALVEGGFSEWSLARARKYKKTGGERVLLACGTRNCIRKAEASATWLRQAGVDTRVVSDPTAGHTYGGGVAEKVHANLDWLLEGGR